MKNMSQAQEINQAPLPGKRASTCVASGTEISRGGDSMVHLTWQIDQGQDGAGAQCDDYLITNGSAKGAGMARRKLRPLLAGSPFERALDTDEEVPDEVIANYCLGRKIVVDYGNEPRMTRTIEGGPYDKPMTVTDNTGKTISLMRLNVQGYVRHNMAPGIPPPGPQQQQQQTQYQPPPQAPAPQQVWQAPPQAPQAPQYQQAPQAPQAQPMPPQTWQPQQPQFVPQAQPQPQAPAPQPAPMQPSYQQAPMQLTPAYPTQVPPQTQPQAQQQFAYPTQQPGQMPPPQAPVGQFPPGFQPAQPPWAAQGPQPGTETQTSQPGANGAAETAPPKKKRRLQTVDSPE